MGPVLTLFLSYKGSLSRWEKQGILSRELLLYLYYIEQGVFRKIQIFSYDASDILLAEKQRAQDPRYHDVIILSPTRKTCPGLLWSLVGPWYYRKIIKQSDVLKTNQMSGSWSALIARYLTNKPLVLRMGYILSRRLRKNGQFFRAAMAVCLEKLAIISSAKIIVSNHASARCISGNEVSSKTAVIPTYVDTQSFAAKQIYDFSQPLVTVARMTEQKNLASLIKTSAEMQLPLTIYGSGPLEDKLKALALELSAPIYFAGQVSNSELSEKLQQHSVFILPSLHEGLPKVLIEAMASGLVCIGSDIPGITDCIEEGKTGYLIQGFEAHDIARTLSHALNYPDEKIGRNARIYAEKYHSLQSYAESEAALVKSLL